MSDTNPLDVPGGENIPVSAATGIAGIALSLAVSYHNGSIISDGSLYQQLKLEGKNIKSIGLEDILDTAKAFEQHLIRSSDRINQMMMDTIESALDAVISGEITPEDEEAEEQASEPSPEE